MYLSDNFETRFNRVGRNDVVNDSPREGFDVFSMLGSEHKSIIANENPSISEHQIQRIHGETFASWFRDHVKGLQLDDNDVISRDLKLLAKGPNVIGKRLTGFLVNGFRFHTKDREKNKKCQNSGLMVSAWTSSFASRKDNHPIMSELNYYGVVKDMIELDYLDGRKIVLFDCDWVSKGRRLKQDEEGFTLTNFTNVKRHNEPFILASQAKQIFYVEDPVEHYWQLVLKIIPRDHYDMEEQIEPNMEQWGTTRLSNDIEDVVLVREDIVGTKVDMPLSKIHDLIQQKKDLEMLQRMKAANRT